ncbi:hypothetical protein K2173_021459 [Erythroxylum novogranatense]|uniref:Scarecrow-like protein 15 n=1 Tax=Erythroxylum novogranatense TaxID=1862640 RepID=A0AAV8TUW1_9ROSI|nr:hypothetical protein K2173_021459 [Erythroxylum novogranatense]
MRVPVSSQQKTCQSSPSTKPVSCSNTNNTRVVGFHANTPQTLCYEPTSVLDLRRSPSPAPGKPATAATDALELDDHVLQGLDWESIMRELDFHDDSSPSLIKNFPQFCESQVQNHHIPDFIAPPLQLDPSQFLHSELNDTYLNSISFHHNFSALELSNNSFHNITNWNVGFDYIQELIRAADCFDSNELQLAHAILERLNLRLQSPIGKPLQRAAFFFKEALHSLLTRQPSTRGSSLSDVVQTIRSYKAFSALSPIPMFTHCTTNQALLESLDGSPPFVHIVDFDIGLGCHYPSLIRELVEKAESCKLTYPLLRITAVVTEDCAMETKLIKESISQFAHELKIRLQIEFVLMRTFELLSFKAIKFMEGEKTAVLLSPSIFRVLGSTSNLTMFATDLSRVSPNVVIFVDSEGWSEPEASFRRNFVNCLEFYSLMLESLDVTVAGGEWVRKIETFLLKPRILAATERCRWRASPPWREVFSGAGMWPVKLSQFADFQAESLLEKVQARGFYVAKQQSELVLCWHERPLIAMSAWKC